MLAVQTIGTQLRTLEFHVVKERHLLIFKSSNYRLLVKENAKGEEKPAVAAQDYDWYFFRNYQSNFKSGDYKLDVQVNLDGKSFANEVVVFDITNENDLKATNNFLPDVCLRSPTFEAKIKNGGWDKNTKKLILDLTCGPAKGEGIPLDSSIEPKKNPIVNQPEVIEPLQEVFEPVKEVIESEKKENLLVEPIVENKEEKELDVEEQNEEIEAENKRILL
jgi:hypothetical protein